MVQLGDMSEVGALQDVVPCDVLIHVPLHQQINITVYLQPQTLLGGALPDGEFHPAVESPRERPSLIVLASGNNDASVQVQKEGLPGCWILADADQGVTDGMQVQGQPVGVHASWYWVAQPRIVGRHPDPGRACLGQIMELIGVVSRSVSRAAGTVRVRRRGIELLSGGVRVAVLEVTAHGMGRAGSQTGYKGSVEGHPDADALRCRLVLQVSWVARRLQLLVCIRPILERPRLDEVVASPYLGLDRTLCIRQAAVVASQTEDGLPHGLEVDSVFLVTVLAHHQLQRAREVPLDAATGSVRMLVALERLELDVLLRDRRTDLENQHPLFGDVPSGRVVFMGEPDGITRGGHPGLNVIGGIRDRIVGTFEVRPETSCAGQFRKDRLENLAVGALVEQVEADQGSLAAFQDEPLAGGRGTLVEGRSQRGSAAVRGVVEVLVGEVSLAVNLELALGGDRGTVPGIRRGAKDMVDEAGLHRLGRQRIVEGEFLYLGDFFGERNYVLLAVHVPVGPGCARLEVEGILP